MNRGSKRINSLGLGSSIEILFAFWQKEIHQLRLQIKFSSRRQSLRNHRFHLWSIYLYSTKCLQVFLLELWVFVKACSVLKMIFIPPSVPTAIFYNSDIISLHEKIKMETFEKEILLKTIPSSVSVLSTFPPPERSGLAASTFYK